MTLYETETETETAKMHYTSPRPRLRPLSLARLETRRESRLCLLLIFLTTGHVIHYGLFLRDTVRDEPMESLDDIIYYMKSFIALLELASALFVICAGVKDGWVGNWSGKLKRVSCL